jgi:hypothetical protein
MARQKSQKKKGGEKKYGRNKKPVDYATSLYVRGKITFEKYKKMKGQ